MSEHIVKAPHVPPFVTFVTSAVPMVFDNSLSYYEALCALWKWLQDDVVNVINNNATVTEEYINLTNELKTFVDDYFDNLDVQEEINNKLDQMAEDGTLEEIMAHYLEAKVAWCFNTVADMKDATNLVDGSYAQTCGYYALSDGGASEYKIRPVENTDIIDEMFILSLPNTTNLVAELVIKNELHTKQLGLKGDNTTDETTKLNAFFEKSLECNKKVVDEGVYLTSGTVFIKGTWRQNTGNNGLKRIVFENASIHYSGTANGASVVIYDMFKHNVSGLCITRDSSANYVQIVGCWHLNYSDWDIADLHIDNSSSNLTGKTYSTLSNEYIAANNVYVKGTLTIGATSPTYTNVISFYNSIIDGTDKSYCVSLLGATSKQNIQFISSDLSYATDAVYYVDEAQTGGCNVTAFGCYYDSSIKVFYNDDKKGVLYTSLATFEAANTNQEIQNLNFTDYNKDSVLFSSSPFGNNLGLANVNYAVNGNLAYQSNQSGNYNNLMGAGSSAWQKSYVSDSKSINGKARRMVTNNAGNYGFTVEAVNAPRTDKYCAFAHFKVVSGSFTEIKISFKGQYITIPAERLGNKEVVLLHNKYTSDITEGTSLSFSIDFVGAEAGLTVDFYEVGVTAGSTYVPNMPVDSAAVISA